MAGLKHHILAALYLVFHLFYGFNFAQNGTPIVFMVENSSKASNENCVSALLCEDLKQVISLEALKVLSFCDDKKIIKNENDGFKKCPNFEDIDVCLCTKVTDCVPLNDLIKQRRFNELKNFESCGFDKKIPKYCCPLPFSLLGRGKFETEQEGIKNADKEDTTEISSSSSSTTTLPSLVTTTIVDMRAKFFEKLNLNCGFSIEGGEQYPWMAGWLLI